MEQHEPTNDSAGGSGSGSPGKVMVVDDESVVCDTVADILVAGGYECARAYTAPVALERLAEDAFDCLVTDVRMPGMDGIELLKRAREIDPEIQVVLMTGLVDAATAIAALKTGACDYVVKPFDVEEILHCVGRAITHRRLVLENRDYQLHLEDMVAQQAETIRRQFLSAIQSLAKAVEARDPYTRGHSDRVSHLAGRIAGAIGLNPEECNLVRLAGLLHDIGKMGVPDAILQKRGSLSANEWRVMQAHPAIGRDIIKQIDPPETLVEGIFHHHERWDGKGYPQNCGKDSIPLVGRILAIADSYDAMTSARPYRGAFSPAEAMEKINEARGFQLDPKIVTVALSLLESDNAHSAAPIGGCAVNHAASAA